MRMRHGGMHSSGKHKEYVELPDDLSHRGGTVTALCHGHEDPELWFPERRNTTAKAVAICKQCPMIDACRQHALDNRIEHGIWGGQTEAERAKVLRRPRKRSKRTTPRVYKTHPRPEPPSEVRGVSWNCLKGRWVVIIRHGGQEYWVGQFAAKADAEAAAIAKCAELGTTTVRMHPGRRVA